VEAVSFAGHRGCSGAGRLCEPTSTLGGLTRLRDGLLEWASRAFRLIGSLFNGEIRMYAFPNSGVWYDFGFLLGLRFLGWWRRSSRFR